MLNQPALQFLEKSSGFSLASLFEKLLGISARTFRKPDLTSISQKRINEAVQFSRRRTLRNFTRAGYSLEDANKWLTQHPGSERSGMLYSTIIFESERNEAQYPHTMELARNIDELSSMLYKARVSEDLNGFKYELMNSMFADPAYFAQSVEELDFANPLMLEQFQLATDWTSIETPLKVVALNTLFSLLARWDVEFCSARFTSFSPASCFSRVLPRIDPKAGDVFTESNIAIRRDMFHYPARRLLDMLACMAIFSKNKDWPEKIPTVSRMEIDADIRRSKLVSFRDATTAFTENQFTYFWNSYCQVSNKNPKKIYSDEPWPLFVAATFFQTYLVRVSATNSKQKSLLLVDSHYDFWWHRQLELLKLKGCTLGEMPWPSCFNDI